MSDLYDRAVAIVRRDQKASTSYLQRRLLVGYNRAADLMERMEREGIVSAPGTMAAARWSPADSETDGRAFHRECAGRTLCAPAEPH